MIVGAAAGRAAHGEHNLKPKQSTAARKCGNNAPPCPPVSWPLSQPFVLARTIINYWYRFRSRVTCSVWIIHFLFGQSLTKSSTMPPTMCRSLKQKCTTSSYSMWSQVCRNVSCTLRRAFLQIWLFITFHIPNSSHYTSVVSKLIYHPSETQWLSPLRGGYTVRVGPGMKRLIAYKHSLSSFSSQLGHLFYV